MGSHRRKMVVFALGAVFVALGSLGLSAPNFSERSQAGSADTPEGGSCACRSGQDQACCSGGSGTCACSLNDEAGQKDDGKKDEKKMASAEAKAKGVAARKAVVTHQKALLKEGVWGCCIKPGCAFCQTAADMCPCAKNLANGDAVCPECWGGWQAGTGRLEGIEAKKVKIIPQDKLKMMYQMRAKNFEKVTGGADQK